jgi:Protein of unknown function (DUF2865)
MQATLIANVLRGMGIGGLLLLALAPAKAQFGFPGSAPAAQASPPPSTTRNPVCLRLEGQLAMIDRGTTDPAKAEQIKRYEDAAAKQQAELDRLGQQSQRMGCQGGGFFALFSGQAPQCIPLNNQMQQVRANIDGLLNEIPRLQGNSGEREGQRRGILVALGQNDCGPQYRQFATSAGGGFFDTLFGNSSAPAVGVPLAGTYRTLCVRSCDGYYFPISYSTVPGKFAEDEQLCRRLCPAAEVMLFSHRNPGEDVSRAVSISGRPYAELPTAFSYRKQLNPSCSCRAPGQSWADALRAGEDQSLERGDIVVTEERARQLSQPRFDAQGKPVNIDPNPARQPLAGRNPNELAAPSGNAPVTGGPLPPVQSGTPTPSAASDNVEEDTSKRKVRSVGPTFYPAR